MPLFNPAHSQLRKREPPMEFVDPSLPAMGDEHSVISFLKAEKLEFSSLQHAKFSTMLLLRYLTMETKPTLERWPHAVVPSDSIEGAVADESAVLEAKASTDHKKSAAVSAPCAAGTTMPAETALATGTAVPVAVVTAAPPAVAAAVPVGTALSTAATVATPEGSTAARPEPLRLHLGPIAVVRTTSSPLVLGVTVSPALSPSLSVEKPSCGPAVGASCGPGAGPSACAQPVHDAGGNGDVVMAT